MSKSEVYDGQHLTEARATIRNLRNIIAGNEARIKELKGAHDRADKAAEWTEETIAAIYAYMRAATYPSWSNGDCRLCKYDETGLNGHAAGCPYAAAYAALVALVGDPFDELNLLNTPPT